MNRLLTLVIGLLVLGIALSRTNDILILLSPYEAAELTGSAPSEPAPPLRAHGSESDLAGAAM